MRSRSLALVIALRATLSTFSIALAQTSGNIPIGSGPSATPCDPVQNPHVYLGVPLVLPGVADIDAHVGARTGQDGLESASDGCNADLAIAYDVSDPTALDATCIANAHVCLPGSTAGLAGGDGDPDLGLGGGAFPAGACVRAPTVAHHANAVGAAYSITSVLPLVPAALVVGTDGGSTDGACTGGNGIASDDPLTDPYDCGSGNVGFSSPMTGAFLAPNTVGLSCVPADGHVAAFALTGLVNRGGTETVVVSLQGFIGDAGF